MLLQDKSVWQMFQSVELPGANGKISGIGGRKAFEDGPSYLLIVNVSKDEINSSNNAKPRISTKADISTGDHPGTNILGTFYPLFPKGNYFGVLATTGPGPLNFIDFHPRVEGTFPYGIAASFDWIFHWRQSLEDGVYSVPGFLIRAADGSRARFVGHRPGTEVRWQVNTHLWFQGDYGIFYAGRFLKETKPGQNLNYWALWAGYEF